MDRDAGHLPVLQEQVIDLLAPAGRHLVVDCTVGLGGHAEALLQAAGTETRLIGIDVDEQNLRQAQQRLEPFVPRVRLFRANFSQVTEVLAEAGETRADALLADLGVCSAQLDRPEQGLSFQVDGPLDMRLDDRIETTAAELVNSLGEKELADVIYTYGEERYSRRIARAIVAARKQGRIERTGRLAEVVAGAYPPPARKSRRGVHPATRTFQALRIAVNDELGALEQLLAQLPGVLSPGARAAMISFHSLEDRRVKLAFRDWARAGAAELLTRKPLTATAEQRQRNPRARSAKLRVMQWTG
ncbi:MAG: 16S rRNA (cytosine(1402)-N(4))-methyltransferase RsmH [Planctomycetota bacterium]